MLLWYSRSGGIFCRVQSNALPICALFKYNILIDALTKVRHATEDHWSALGMKNHLETWSRFLSPNLTNLSPGCQLAYFFFFFSSCTMELFQGPEPARKVGFGYIFYSLQSRTRPLKGVPQIIELTLNHTLGENSPLQEPIFALLSLVRSLISLDRTEEMLFVLKMGSLLYLLFSSQNLCYLSPPSLGIA